MGFHTYCSGRQRSGFLLSSALLPPTAHLLFSLLHCLKMTMQRAEMAKFEEMAKNFTVADTPCVTGASTWWTEPVAAFFCAHTRERKQGAVILVGCSKLQKKALALEVRRQDPEGSQLVDLSKEKCRWINGAHFTMPGVAASQPRASCRSTC